MSKFYFSSTAPSHAAFMRVYRAGAESGDINQEYSRITLGQAVNILESINAGTVTIDGAHSEEPYTREQAQRALRLLTAFRNRVVPAKEKKDSDKKTEAIDMNQLSEALERAYRALFADIMRPWEDVSDDAVAKKKN